MVHAAIPGPKPPYTRGRRNRVTPNASAAPAKNNAQQLSPRYHCTVAPTANIAINTGSTHSGNGLGDATGLLLVQFLFRQQFPLQQGVRVIKFPDLRMVQKILPILRTQRLR